MAIKINGNKKVINSRRTKLLIAKIANIFLSGFKNKTSLISKMSAKTGSQQDSESACR